jgi:hypothetical protein
MSKTTIEIALVNAITHGGLHGSIISAVVGHPRKNLLVIPMASFLPDCLSKASVYYPFGGTKIIDLVSFMHPIAIGIRPVNIDASGLDINWGLEARHFSPHQGALLRTYIKDSLTGPIRDLLKLIDCRFNKMYILQLQTEIVDFTIHPPFTYTDLLHDFSFFNWLGMTEPDARANIATIAAQHRITALETESRLKLDSNLIYGNVPGLVADPIADIRVKIHYLISGPFDRATLVTMLVAQGYDPLHRSCEEQAIEEGRVLTTDVQIESDPEE